MAVQDTYTATQRAAVAGAIGTMIPATFISRTVMSDAGIAFGRAAEQNTSIDNGVNVYAGGAFKGVAVLERGVDRVGVAGNTFAKFDAARLMTKGHVWVTVSTNVAAGGKAYLSATGTWTATNTDKDIDGEFDTSATSGNLALLRLK